MIHWLEMDGPTAAGFDGLKAVETLKFSRPILVVTRHGVSVCTRTHTVRGEQGTGVQERRAGVVFLLARRDRLHAQCHCDAGSDTMATVL